MATPATPSNFFVQQGNQQTFSSWDLVPGATSYSVQRSTDGVNYTTVATPSTPSYLDTTVTIGTQYYYQAAATNISGTSPYTTPQSVVPTISGEMSLGELRQRSQQRADRLNSNFVTLPEWNSYINESLFELYDLLVNSYEEYFVAPVVSFTTDGQNSLYALPNGVNFSAAPPFYRLMGVDLALSSSPNGFVTIKKFNFIERNKYVYPNTASTIYGVYNLSYRLLGNQIEFIPLPSGNQTIRLWYIPRMPMLLKDNDVSASGISGWLEYIITDAAIKALQKEESDVSVLMAQKQALKIRIEESAVNRDVGQADTISDVRTANFWAGNGNSGSQVGPF